MAEPVASASSTAPSDRVEPPLPQLRFRLPGEWWPVPLTDPTALEESLRGLARRKIGPQDDRAVLRAQLRERTRAAALAARDGGGVMTYLALEIVEDAPLPTSFTVFLPEQRLTPVLGTGPDAVVDLIEQGLRSLGVNGIESAERLDTPVTQGLRIHRTLVTPLAESDRPAGSVPDEVPWAAEERRTLVADYWLAVPGRRRFVLVTFSTPLVPLQDVMLGLFDSIVQAAYWAEAPSAASADAETTVVT
ncbi:hypothetical protein [Schumannella sp. 10F1B-5-1]|uniref:hypothetical protein n=1 Tax=Schumannella sp. 10F1B-5-1 TaxID=2590780 RepID=UPI00113078AD|nr:hypothetical protein [Schumannella sp. 10F1B-5-1]TPW72267.1 hypothetical protein FJ658_08315 [Schumannella sp. 10F1B-5-1]